MATHDSIPVVVFQTLENKMKPILAGEVQPYYEHDCQNCVFLGHAHGSYDMVDLYYCEQNGAGLTFISRYGDRGDYYHSGVLAVPHHQELEIAVLRYLSLGMVL